MDQCLFCRIVAKEIPTGVVYEDEHTIAFLDITPRAPGHTMVISKVHSPDLAGLPQEEVGPLFEAVQKVAEQLVSKLNADGLTIGINQGEVSGQSVLHLHVHLMPRFKGDEGGSVHTVVNNPPQESLQDIQNKLK